MRRAITLWAVLCSTLYPAHASAGGSSLVVSSDKQHTLAVTMSQDGVVAQACAQAQACQAQGGKRYPLPEGVRQRALKFERIPISPQQAVVLVEAPLKSDAKARWVLMLAASRTEDGPSVHKLLSGFVGRTAITKGGQKRRRVLLREPTSQGQDLLVASQFDSATVCGRPASLAVRRLDPATMRWEQSYARSLSRQSRATATRLFAKRMSEDFAHNRPRLLRSTVASSAHDGAHRGLTDGQLDTVWAEGRAGAGRGEFVAMSTARAVPIIGFDLVLRPTGEANSRGAAPRSLWLATSEKIFTVELPEDAFRQPPGTSYRVDLPQPLQTNCIAVVLDHAYSDEQTDQVGIAEFRARSTLDSIAHRPELLARALNGPSSLSAEPARALLLRSADQAAAAVAKHYPKLSTIGQQRALDVLESASCKATTGFFVALLLNDTSGEESARARRIKQRLRACRALSAPLLVDAIRAASPGKAQLRAARELSLLAPARALQAILEVLDQSTGPGRRTLRAALSSAAQQKRARPGVRALLSEKNFEKYSLVAQIDLLRAIGPTLHHFPTAPDAIFAVLSHDPSFRTRYLLQAAVGHVAKNGNARAIASLRDSIGKDASPYIRSRAAEASGGIDALISVLAQAVRTDAHPRVREAALTALGTSQGALSSAVEAVVLKRLADDPWTFVRLSAARALAHQARSPQSDQALMNALEDRSALVRRASLRALGSRKSHIAAQLIYELANNARESTDMRVAAIEALAALCRKDATPVLYKLALRAGPAMLPYDRRLGLAALAALGKIKPPDLAQRLAPLLDPDAPTPRQIRAIAKDVIRRPAACPASN